ncbi:MAG: Asp-tRNA(Asn)/Glu-tRNA(Gln) amidotransferase subunit GatB [Egibacteraceae bacterium]
MSSAYEAVIGLEVHVELGTRTKMFCGCPTDFGGEPNTKTCAVCTGQPGSLPVPNAAAIEAAISLGLALACDVAPRSQFHRKNYFYPDMPKNYQISQYDVPICADGHLDVAVDGATRRIGITRVHMEEDTGKSLHVGGTGRIAGADHSLIDYNRAGIPLLEIVSEPDVRSPEEARAYLAELRGIVRALGISDAKLEEGSMRCDANVSVRREGDEVFGTRVEVKNMNSLRSLQRAVAHEIERQGARLDAGETVTQETRHWDEDAGRTSTLRAKEEVFDYRYFPDPDLVPVTPERAEVERLAAALPELPAQTRARLAGGLGLSDDAAATLVDAGLVGALDDAVAAGAEPTVAAKWLANEVLSWCREADVDPAAVPLAGDALAELGDLVEAGTLSTRLAREVLVGVLEGQGRPGEVAKARGLEQVSDEGALVALVDEAIAADPAAAEKVRGGNDKAIGALVGAVMKASRGQANPQRVNELLRERLAP